MFHIHTTAPDIRTTDADTLYAYIGGILRTHDCIPIRLGGVGDHIHILCVLSRNMALATLVQHIKTGSSLWIKTVDNAYYHTFAWQKGYAGFSVSPSLHDRTVAYIARQPEHHQKVDFRDELRTFLKEYNIEYDEKYIWLDD